jgi:prophage regulatory protein
MLPDRFLRLPAVVEATGLSRATIYRMVAARRFPPPVRIGLQASGWSEAAVAAWIAERKADGRATP